MYRRMNCRMWMLAIQMSRSMATVLSWSGDEEP